MYPNTHHNNTGFAAQQAKQHSALIGAHEGIGIGVPVAEKPEVMREGDMLRREVDLLNDTIDALLRRLEPVTKQVPASASMTETKLPDCYSAVGIDLRNLSERLRGQSARLCGVLETLAV